MVKVSANPQESKKVFLFFSVESHQLHRVFHLAKTRKFAPRRNDPHNLRTNPQQRRWSIVAIQNKMRNALDCRSVSPVRRGRVLPHPAPDSEGESQNYLNHHISVLSIIPPSALPRPDCCLQSQSSVLLSSLSFLSWPFSCLPRALRVVLPFNA